MNNLSYPRNRNIYACAYTRIRSFGLKVDFDVIPSASRMSGHFFLFW